MNRSCCCTATLPACLATGVKFKGAVTQTGVLLDGGYRYESLQVCCIRVLQVDGCSIVCDVHRTEEKQWVNGLSACDGQAQALPDFLRKYLQSNNGWCVERAAGSYDPFTRVLLLRGSWPHKQGDSEHVLWIPHFYTLLVSQQGMSGTVFCMDGMDDRESGVGSLWAERAAD